MADSNDDLVKTAKEAYGQFQQKTIGSLFDPFGIVSDAYHKITGAPTAEEKRNTQNQINAQIKAYKDQTEITRQEIATKKNEQMAEKRRVEEKQIRALRRNYRAQGFLGTQPSAQPDMNTKLGG